jgi:hypothetical protein
LNSSQLSLSECPQLSADLELGKAGFLAAIPAMAQRAEEAAARLRAERQAQDAEAARQQQEQLAREAAARAEQEQLAREAAARAQQLARETSAVAAATAMTAGRVEEES